MSEDKKFKAPGSFVLGVIFLAWFVIVYVTQWMALSTNWFVR